ncbi:antibiotic ABC transporter [Paenirhodobacter sp.]|uniref:antibiotic ABC transporter n=1 Tax=Paenirhodobacter sp. TaxID=1965326 RepID=UPI003B3DC8FC
MLFDPVTPISIALQAARIGFEAQTVIAMRMAGMVGLWETPSSEMTRMVVEKAEAAVEAMEASAWAMMAGKTPDKVLKAGMTEIGRYTSRNMTRLSRMGPVRW